MLRNVNKFSSSSNLIFLDIPVDVGQMIQMGKVQSGNYVLPFEVELPSYRPHKEEQHRTRLTVGGNLLDYEGDASTPTSDLITTKIHLNSVISTKNVKFTTTDIKNFYLNKLLPDSDWMKLPMSIMGYHYFSLHTFSKFNGPIHCIATLIKQLYLQQRKQNSEAFF